ncbi:MAG TPA: DUF2461 domain-containing protein [Candidatus Limnocylindrales bacterium]|nr:DUF2461 domain-containing protein [Candidatus Limnocylindrales bacterium]
MPAKPAHKPSKKPARTPAKKSEQKKLQPAAAAPRKPGKPAAPRKAGNVAAPPFAGFPKDFLAFFRELAKNNERTWFAANKQRYLDSIQAPLRSFVIAMDVPLGRFADCFVADTRSIFRIYNDMRFHEAKPYKEHAACQFRHEAGKDAHAPGFYVHFEPKEVFFGGGIWRPPGPQLRQVREAIAADPERWNSITRAPAFRRRFGAVEGDSLKRPPQGFDPDHPAIEDLKRTSFFAVQTVKPDVIQSKDFVREVAKSFEALAPFMEFLTEAVELPFHRGD